MNLDYPTIIADLEHTGAAIAQVLDGFKQLAGLADGDGRAPKRLHAGGGQPEAPRRRTVHRVSRKARTAPAKAAPPIAPRHRGRQPKELAPDVLARAKKRWWAGDPREEIAAEAGISYSTLYAIAKREHWPKEVRQP